MRADAIIGQDDGVTSCPGVWEELEWYARRMQGKMFVPGRSLGTGFLWLTGTAGRGRFQRAVGLVWLAVRESVLLEGRSSYAWVSDSL
jgi:hypothetical protein